MKIICLVCILFSISAYGQDCTLYDVKMIFNGTIQASHSTKPSIKLPNLDYLKKYNNKAFTKETKEHKVLNNSFSIEVEDRGYDLYHFAYRREYVPIIITYTNTKGRLKTRKINVFDYKFEFYREDTDAKMVFNLGKIELD